MTAGIIAGITWAVATVVLGIALGMSPFCSTEQAIFLAPLDEAQVLISSDEQAWQALWKDYYAAVNIPSRERLKQMKGYLPTRYWKFLPEMQ